uniref:Cellulase n=1 Tax=Calcidiscus leptoporus TaxID=127549 RepID=A0A7S0ITQ0_9EUKA|mmetsp:Transcript_22161/g.50944  ORF Transcript_22161/g.50944 Transcript_22161/m.50944 type:complete len:487 (+) Transcript_22161:821-2281(+)
MRMAFQRPGSSLLLLPVFYLPLLVVWAPLRMSEGGAFCDTQPALDTLRICYYALHVCVGASATSSAAPKRAGVGVAQGALPAHGRRSAAAQPQAAQTVAMPLRVSVIAAPPRSAPPTSAPSLGAILAESACFPGGSSVGVSLWLQKAIAAAFWRHEWSLPPYGQYSHGDKVGVLQVVNGGTEAMWIRYGGNGIGAGQAYDWEPFITKPSKLNGYVAHPFTRLGQHRLVGQGDGFKLQPGEYQLVPFSSSSCWLGGTLGCCARGNDCKISPLGRGPGMDASPGGQPNTLFEWTVPGVWDASLVDGFSLPMKIEVDGCNAEKRWAGSTTPASGSSVGCAGSDAVTFLSLDARKCPNKIIDAHGSYVGCKSMCGCQNAAKSQGVQVDPACPRMLRRDAIENQPHAPGGYCGCAETVCTPWLKSLFDKDPAGLAYCDAITSMAGNSRGERAVYCQAYDDHAGTRSYGNGIIKVTLCNKGFESFRDRSNVC